nr:MAG TPA: hypothetical protein [Caudoviricetes sp.]
MCLYVSIISYSVNILGAIKSPVDHILSDEKVTVTLSPFLDIVASTPAILLIV